MRNWKTWGSTRETAESVYAVAEYAQGGYAKPSAQNADVFLDNRKIASFSFQNNNFKNSIRLPDGSVSAGPVHKVFFDSKNGNFIGDLRLEYYDKEISVAAADNGM